MLKNNKVVKQSVNVRGLSGTGKILNKLIMIQLSENNYQKLILGDIL